MNEVGDAQNSNETSPTGVYQPQESSKKIWIFVWVFVIILVIVLSYFLFMKFPSNISNEDFTKGTSIGLEENKEIGSETETGLEEYEEADFESENEEGPLTCSELSGDICNSTEVCNGNWLNVSDSDSCCEENCAVSIEASETCSSKGLYEYIEGGKGQCIYPPGVVTRPFYNNQSIFCCNVPLTYPIELSDELRNIWNSIQSSGNCTGIIGTDFISKLNSCSSYKCGFIHPLTEENFMRGIIGNYNEKCHSFEEMPNNGAIYCRYNDTQLTDMVDYYTFSEEQCGDGNCSIRLNSTGYFINDILTENVLQDMMDSGDCSAVFE